MEDKRAYKRVSVRMKAAYRDDGFAVRAGTVLNVSRRGMYLETGSGIQVSGFISASIDAEDFGKVIHVQGLVVRRDYRGVGVVFTNADERGLGNILTYHGAPF